MIPLILKIKKAMHKEISRAQDLIIEELYKIFNKAVLHGGTSIWRCYKGNRFSEDINVYLPKDIKRIGLLFENLKKKGFIIEKKKISKNSMFSNLRLNKTIVRLEAIFKEQKGVLKEYETAEGNLLIIYTLLPEELIKEKIDAYQKRYKIRDLYDIFFLLRYIKDRKKIKTKLKIFIDNFKKPLDEKELKILIIEGIVPDIHSMILYIKRFI